MSFASKGRATITISLPQQTEISLNEFTAIAVQREMPLVVFYYQIYALWTEPTWNEGCFTLRGKAHGMIKRRTVEECISCIGKWQNRENHRRRRDALQGAIYTPYARRVDVLLLHACISSG